ncbi:MAG: hypothetical protein HXY45_11370 [Syntrophaceae bacterium]|nr:hypothetical protein [Syntrophaceae bacterium]
MTPEPKKHIIAARNILFGTGYFLILSLPEGWRVTRSYLEPDVHSVVMRDPITWVEAGQTDQVVFHPTRKIGVDLTILIKRGKHESLNPKGVQVSSRGSGTVGGHPAAYFYGEVREGLFKKRTRKTLRVCFYCPELQHTIFLHFTGKCQESELRELHESLAGLECH